MLGRHFIENAASTPNVDLLVVILFIHQLGTHVVGGADMGHGELGLFVHLSRQAEIAYFDIGLVI